MRGWYLQWFWRIQFGHLRLIFVAVLSLGGTNTQAASGYPFDEAGWLAPAAELPTWGAALARHKIQRELLEPCLRAQRQCEGVERSLEHLLRRAAELDKERQIRLINGYVNKRRYRNDRGKREAQALTQHRPIRNHWSTLMEFMRRGGDCEDYATAKYFLLRELGFAANDLRVVVTYDRRVRDNHAVVALRRADGDVWLLDTDTIRRKTHFGYQYVFAVNELSIWDHQPVK